jgi:dipeptidyl aminopeptidase/acylaminoacyl peptidase
MYAAGHLLFVREQTLLAQPFDVQRLELTGTAVPIAEDVAVGGASGVLGGFAVSQNGVLAYQPGPSEVGGSGAGTPTRLTWFDRSGNEIAAFGDRAGHGDLELAPGGTRVAVSLFDLAQRTRDIWHFDIGRGLRTRFTFDAADELATVWSPDGSRVVFNAFRNGRFDLYQKASNGIGAEEMLLGDSLNKVPLDWSSDGRFVLFSSSSTPGTQTDLWVLPLFGDRKPFPFLQTPANELRGRFSPDGRWIAYVSNESGRNDVYVAPFSGRGSKWQISAAGGNFPRWRRDGKEIFYLAPDNTLMSVGVNGAGSAFETGTVRPLFQARVSIQARWMYDVSPDGQRFLVNALAQETTSVPLTLLVNWASLLTQ